MIVGKLIEQLQAKNPGVETFIFSHGKGKVASIRCIREVSTMVLNGAPVVLISLEPPVELD